MARKPKIKTKKGKVNNDLNSSISKNQRLISRMEQAEKEINYNQKVVTILCRIIFILTVGLMFADKTFSNAKSSVKRVIYVGQSCKFPFTANVRLYYSSSNPNVAKVSDDGKITGIRKGNAIWYICGSVQIKRKACKKE